MIGDGKFAAMLFVEAADVLIEGAGGGVDISVGMVTLDAAAVDLWLTYALFMEGPVYAGV